MAALTREQREEAVFEFLDEAEVDPRMIPTHDTTPRSQIEVFQCDGIRWVAHKRRMAVTVGPVGGKPRNITDLYVSEEA